MLNYLFTLAVLKILSIIGFVNRMIFGKTGSLKNCFTEIKSQPKIKKNSFFNPTNAYYSKDILVGENF